MELAVLSCSDEWINTRHCRHKHPAASQKSATWFFGAWKKFAGRWGSHEGKAGNRWDCCSELLDLEGETEVQTESKTLFEISIWKIYACGTTAGPNGSYVSTESVSLHLFTSGKANITPPLNSSEKSLHSYANLKALIIALVLNLWLLYLNYEELRHNLKPKPAYKRFINPAATERNKMSVFISPWKRLRSCSCSALNDEKPLIRSRCALNWKYSKYFRTLINTSEHQMFNF